MSAITLQQAQTQLDRYLAAEAAVLLGQSYEINGRKLTRADLKAIQDGVEIWNSRVTQESQRAARRGRSRTIVSGG